MQINELYEAMSGDSSAFLLDKDMLEYIQARGLVQSGSTFVPVGPFFSKTPNLTPGDWQFGPGFMGFGGDLYEPPEPPHPPYVYTANEHGDFELAVLGDTCYGEPDSHGYRPCSGSPDHNGQAMAAVKSLACMVNDWLPLAFVHCVQSGGDASVLRLVAKELRKVGFSD